MAEQDPKQEKPERKKQGSHQQDQAEGDLETVEESIRIHEEKKDEQGKR